MISLRDSQITDILPDVLKYRPDIQAFSYALHVQIAKICDLSERCKMLANIDALPEDVLDLLAIELQSIYYDTSLPIDKKRAVIKATLRWHWYGGTKASVEDYVRTVFGGGSVREWFEYGSDPYTFRIDADDTGTTIQVGKVIDTIYKIKRPDTTFDTYIGNPATVLIGTTEQGWIVYHSPAGTIPDESTRLSLDPATIKAAIKQNGYKSDRPVPGDLTTGTKPDESTRLSIDEGTVAAAPDPSGYLVEPEVSGDAMTGEKPAQSTRASISDGGEALTASLEAYSVRYQTCGSQDDL